MLKTNCARQGLIGIGPIFSENEQRRLLVWIADVFVLRQESYI